MNNKLLENKIRRIVKKVIKEETFQRFNLEVIKDKPAISKKYDTPNYKIVRSAYDDYGNNAYIIYDKKNNKIISYSISGVSEFRKWDTLP